MRFPLSRSMLDWVSAEGLEEGGVDADALPVKLKEVVVFWDFVPAYPCSRNGGVAGWCWPCRR